MLNSCKSHFPFVCISNALNQHCCTNTHTQTQLAMPVFFPPVVFSIFAFVFHVQNFLMCNFDCANCSFTCATAVCLRSIFFSLLIHFWEIQDLFVLLQCAYGTHTLYVCSNSISATTRQNVFRSTHEKHLKIFISPFSHLSCYPTISPSQSLTLSHSLTISHQLVWSIPLLSHSIVHVLSVCLVNEWTGQFINIKFGSALFPVYPLLVYDMVFCETFIVDVGVCMLTAFLPPISIRAAIWLGCLLHIHYLYISM